MSLIQYIAARIGANWVQPGTLSVTALTRFLAHHAPVTFDIFCKEKKTVRKKEIADGCIQHRENKHGIKTIKTKRLFLSLGNSPFKGASRPRILAIKQTNTRTHAHKYTRARVHTHKKQRTKGYSVYTPTSFKHRQGHAFPLFFGVPYVWWLNPHGTYFRSRKLECTCLTLNHFSFSLHTLACPSLVLSSVDWVGTLPRKPRCRLVERLHKTDICRFTFFERRHSTRLDAGPAASTSTQRRQRFNVAVARYRGVLVECSLSIHRVVIG